MHLSDRANDYDSANTKNIAFVVNIVRHYFWLPFVVELWFLMAVWLLPRMNNEILHVSELIVSFMNIGRSWMARLKVRYWAERNHGVVILFTDLMNNLKEFMISIYFARCFGACLSIRERDKESERELNLLHMPIDKNNVDILRALALNLWKLRRCTIHFFSIWDQFHRNPLTLKQYTKHLFLSVWFSWAILPFSSDIFGWTIIFALVARLIELCLFHHSFAAIFHQLVHFLYQISLCLCCSCALVSRCSMHFLLLFHCSPKIYRIVCKCDTVTKK